MPHIPDTPFSRIDGVLILSSKQEVVVYNCIIYSEDNVKPAEPEKIENLDGNDSDNEQANQPKEEEKSARVLFKVGDDLRKDQVVLQVFKLFDDLCKHSCGLA